MKRILERIDVEFTPDRAKGFALIGFVVFALIMGWVIYRTITNWGETYFFGFDFSSFWAAAKLAVEGNAHWAFDIERFDRLQDLAARTDGRLFWYYPPTWVALIYPLGYLSPPTALFVFTGLITAIWVATVRAMIPAKRWIERVAVLFCPGFYMCIVGAQNGLIVTGLLCLFILGVFQRKDWMVVLACTLLLFKPHFGVLMPIVLAATGRWRAFGLSALFGVIFIAASTAITGWAYVEAFFGNHELVETMTVRTGLLDQQPTLFALLASLGLPHTGALVTQFLFAVGIIVGIFFLYRNDGASDDLKIAGFLFGSVLISPYAFGYDFAASVIAMWYMFRATRENPIAGQNLLIALVWLVPYVNQRLYTETGVSVGFIPIALLVWVFVKHVFQEHGRSPSSI